MGAKKLNSGFFKSFNFFNISKFFLVVITIFYLFLVQSAFAMQVEEGVQFQTPETNATFIMGEDFNFTEVEVTQTFLRLDNYTLSANSSNEINVTIYNLTLEYIKFNATGSSNTTFAIDGLTPNTSYTVYKNSSELQIIETNSTGYLGFTDYIEGEHSFIIQPTEEGPPEEYCGDGICQANETCSTCPEDCGPCSTGGKTSGAYIPPCAENWTCTEWSECSPDGNQTRNCTDLNECGTVQNKPNETQECEYVPPCAENWTCTEWSECSPDGNQTRNCTDLNECGTVQNKPEELQGCTPIPTPFCGDEICQDDEDCSTCEADCGVCVERGLPTGFAILTNPAVLTAIIGAILLSILLYLLYRKKPKGKEIN